MCALTFSGLVLEDTLLRYRSCVFELGTKYYGCPDIDAAH